MTANHFAEVVRDYILDFQDPHIHFNLIKSESQTEWDNGFRTRRYQDKLYVTSLTTESRLHIGDALIALDNTPILTLVERHQRELMESKAEREDWHNIIFKYHTAEVMDSFENVRMLELKTYEKAVYHPEHILKKIDNDTSYMKLTDFFSAGPIDELIEENKNTLNHTANLILDMRYNLGGSTLAYKSLEKYLFPKGNHTIDFSFYNSTFNCTERNAALMIKAINAKLEKIENEEHREGLRQFKEQTWERHKGKGFVNFEESSDNIYELQGHEYPKRLIILTDNYCVSAGDIFVYFCKQSPKVTAVGRPTMGINDYSNLTVKTWDNQFELFYPTSRLNQLDDRDPESEQGIQPDIYIPWTPEHIEKDIDMEVACKVLQEEDIE